MAKGYTQHPGEDYDQTFDPVVQLSAIHILLALATMHDWEVVQLDVKTAFLKGFLQEDIYMLQPHGYVVKGKEKDVCKLKRSIYGLKQSGKSWYERMGGYLIVCGFSKCPSDGNIYIRRSCYFIVILALYVDDCIIFSIDGKGLLAESISMLKSEFGMSDLGNIHYCLGIQIHRNKSGLHI